MPRRPNLLSNHPGFALLDQRAAGERISSLFGARKFDTGQGGNHAEVRFLQRPAVSLIHGQYDGTVALGFDEASFVRQYFTLDGAGRYTVDGGPEREMKTDGPGAIVAAGRKVAFEFRGYDQLVLRIEQQALKKHLEILIGAEVADELTFDDGAATNPALASFRRFLMHFIADHNIWGENRSELVRLEADRMLIMNFLIGNWHNYSYLLHRTPLTPSTTAIDRVREYLEANWDRPFDIEELTRVANVSARSVFRHFQKLYGCSPLQFTKQIRLERARAMLERPERNVTVLSTAFKCGFQNPSHFARDFKDAFGELPSDVLRRATRQH